MPSKTAYHTARELMEKMYVGKKFTLKSIAANLESNPDILHSPKQIKNSVRNACSFLMRHNVVRLLENKKPFMYEKMDSKELQHRKPLCIEDRILALAPTEIGKRFMVLLRSKDKDISRLVDELRNLKEDYDSMSDIYYDTQSALIKCKEELCKIKRESK